MEGTELNFRDESAPNVFNSVITDFNTSLKLDNDGLLYWESTPPLAAMTDTIFNNQKRLNSESTPNGDELFTNGSFNNSEVDPLIGGVSYTQDQGLDPRPQAGSPALGAVNNAQQIADGVAETA